MPLCHSHYRLAAETFLLDSRLEKVSFPNSPALFLAVAASQTLWSCIGFPPSLAFEAKLSTVGESIWPLFLGAESKSEMSWWSLALFYELSGTCLKVICCGILSTVSSARS